MSTIMTQMRAQVYLLPGHTAPPVPTALSWFVMPESKCTGSEGKGAFNASII